MFLVLLLLLYEHIPISKKKRKVSLALKSMNAEFQYIKKDQLRSPYLLGFFGTRLSDLCQSLIAFRSWCDNRSLMLAGILELPDWVSCLDSASNTDTRRLVYVKHKHKSLVKEGGCQLSGTFVLWNLVSLCSSRRAQNTISILSASGEEILFFQFL